MSAGPPSARPAFIADPADYGQAKHWLEITEAELHRTSTDLANAAIVRPELSPEELREWKKRLSRFVLHLARRRKYLKNRVHAFHNGVDIPLLHLRGPEAEAAHNAMQQQVAEKRKAARQAEYAERNRRRRVVAHREDTTNPYLLLGALKELLESILDHFCGDDRQAVPLTVDDKVLLAIVRNVVRSPEARESIDRYVATKIVEDEKPRLS